MTKHTDDAADEDSADKIMAFFFFAPALCSALFATPFVEMKVWNWFSPLVVASAPALTYGQAFAASMLLGYVASRIYPRPGKKTWKKIGTYLFGACLTPWVILGVSWAVYHIALWVS